MNEVMASGTSVEELYSYNLAGCDLKLVFDHELSVEELSQLASWSEVKEYAGNTVVVRVVPRDDIGAFWLLIPAGLALWFLFRPQGASFENYLGVIAIGVGAILLVYVLLR